MPDCNTGHYSISYQNGNQLLITKTKVIKMETSSTEKESQREKELLSLGFAKRIFGFSFNIIFVTSYHIKYMTDDDWNRYIDYLTKSVANTKLELSKIPDKKKLLDFVKELKSIAGPECRGEQERILSEGLIGVLRDFVLHAEEEIKSLPDEQTA
jgi:hypothetical protein